MGCGASAEGGGSAKVIKAKHDPQGYPDLSKHSNFMAEVLTKDMYD